MMPFMGASVGNHPRARAWRGMGRQRFLERVLPRAALEGNLFRRIASRTSSCRGRRWRETSYADRPEDLFPFWVALVGNLLRRSPKHLCPTPDARYRDLMCLVEERVHLRMQAARTMRVWRTRRRRGRSASAPLEGNLLRTPGLLLQTAMRLTTQKWSIQRFEF